MTALRSPRRTWSCAAAATRWACASPASRLRLRRPFAHRDLIAAAGDDARLIVHRDPELTSPRGKALQVLQELFDWKAGLACATPARSCRTCGPADASAARAPHTIAGDPVVVATATAWTASASAAQVTRRGDVRTSGPDDHGEPATYALTSDAGNTVTRLFCGACGSPLFGRTPACRVS
jgi:hypothetical protein